MLDKNENQNSSLAAKVYEIVARVPAGKVATYGQIAEMMEIELDARDVGHVMHHAPAGRGLPCHRVVNKTGMLAPDYVFGGQEIQRSMLEAEGITFLSDGRIQMERHLWGDYEQLLLDL